VQMIARAPDFHKTAVLRPTGTAPPSGHEH
jgi:hypothetical protein